MTTFPLLIIGATGALLLLIAFALQKFGLLEEGYWQYDLLNFSGAGLLTWYAVLLHSWPFIILEGIWALVALWYLLRRFARK